MRRFSFLPNANTTAIIFILSVGVSGSAVADSLPHLMQALKSEEPDQREHAAEALGQMGPEAEPAVKALGTALDDDFPYVRSHAADALAKIGPASIPVFIEALKNKNDEIRATAASALGHFGTKASSAVPGLVSMLHDSVTPVRERAAHALAQIGPEAVDPLLRVAESDQDSARLFAIQTLGAIPSTNERVIPQLVRLLGQDKSQISIAASKALVRQGHAHVSELVQGLEADQPETRAQVADILGDVGRPAAKAVPALLSHLKDTSPKVRAAAAHALGQMGSVAAKTAVTPLKELLLDSNATVKARAQEALTNLTAAIQPTDHPSEESPAGPSVEKVTAAPLAVKPVPVKKVKPVHKVVPKKLKKSLTPEQLIKMLQSSDERVRAGARQSLVQMGGQALPSLTAALQDGTTNVRQTAASVYVEVDSTAAIAAFQACAQTKDLGVRLDALRALESMGPRAASATPALIPLLEDPNSDIPPAATAALEHFGSPESKKVLEAFHKRQRDKKMNGLVKDLRSSGSLSDAAANELTKMGVPAVSPVAQVLNNPQVTARRAAAHVLNRLGAQAMPATQSLINALNDVDPEVRAQAAETLAKINSPEANKALRLFPLWEKLRQLRQYLHI